MVKEEWMSCVFCGLEFPHKEYSKDREALIEHIRVCPKHPMSKLLRDYDRVRSALVLFIGADTRAELTELEKIIQRMKYREMDLATRKASLNAIRVLIDTLPYGESS